MEAKNKEYYSEKDSILEDLQKELNALEEIPNQKPTVKQESKVPQLGIMLAAVVLWPLFGSSAALVFMLAATTYLLYSHKKDD